jgi:hypothetical protein
MKKEIDFLYNIMDYDPDDKMFAPSLLGIFPIIYSTLAVFGPLSGEKFIMKLPYFLYMIFYIFSTKSYFLKGRKLKQNFKKIGIKGQKEIENIMNTKEKADEVIKENIEKNPKINHIQKLELFRKSFVKILDEKKEEIKTKELKLQKENNRIKKINKTPLLKRFEISINDSIALVIMVYLGILAGKQYMWLQISLVTFCFIFCFYVMMPAFRIFRFLKKNDIKVGFVEFDRILDNIKNMREDATVNGHFYKKVYYKKVKRFIEKYKKFKGSFPENKKINKEQDLKKNFEEISEMLELDNGKVLNLEKED